MLGTERERPFFALPHIADRKMELQANLRHVRLSFAFQGFDE